MFQGIIAQGKAPQLPFNLGSPTYGHLGQGRIFGKKLGVPVKHEVPLSLGSQSALRSFRRSHLDALAFENRPESHWTRQTFLNLQNLLEHVVSSCFGMCLGCCWETFYMFAYFGLVVEIQIHLTAKI